jgi:hypothetical protein
MKTQLLEDIGESATLSLEPSGKVSNFGIQKGRQAIAHESAAAPVRPRAAFGVWRQKPEGEPVAIATPPPDQPPPPAVVALPDFEPTFAANAAHSDPAPQGPQFDFTLPPLTTPAPDLPKREPGWFERSGRRYLLWGSCVLAGALVIQAAWWLYDERQDAGAQALVADEVKVAPQLPKAAKRRAFVAKEFTLAPDGAVQVAPVASPRPAPTIPPLVLLKPEPPADTRLQAPRQPQPVVEQAPAAPPPNALHRAARQQQVPISRPARAKAERVPERRLASEPAAPAEKKPAPESAASATLNACKAHGYTAAQCVKQACSVTKYGFVCRGK